jgi:hypothetical protein
MIENLGPLFAIFVLAIFVEGFVEYFVSTPDKAQPWVKYVAAALGVVLSIAYGLDLLAALGVATVYPFVGSVITGLIVGRGSNYLNDFVSRVRAPKSSVSVTGPDMKTTVNTQPASASDLTV